MTVMFQLSPKQEEQIPIYIEKWKAIACLTTPIERTKFESGLKAVHQEIGLKAPSEFLYFSSPAAMWREFDDWKPKITRVLTQYWSYQIPLCDPGSMHRLSSPGNHRQAFNFAAKRKSPGWNFALRETRNSRETSGILVEKEFHKRLWERFEFESPFDWRLLGYYTVDEDGPIEDYLWERAHKEDPTSQIHYQEECFLAPEKWLLKELACVDFCFSVLGVERNDKLYRGLEEIVRNGSFCGTFGQLCVACERPISIEVNEDQFKLTYRDGEVFSCKHEW